MCHCSNTYELHGSFPQNALTHVLSLLTFGCLREFTKVTFHSSYQVNAVPRSLEECCRYKEAKLTHICVTRH